MKITKTRLKQIIKEEIAVVNQETIADTVMDVLSAEGGAAGTEPIEDALEDLEDEDISLPDESIEDIISGVAGVKRHADGDYIDTTQLEGVLKMSKHELSKIIKTSLLETSDAFRDRRTGKNLFFMINDAVDQLLNNGFDAIELANELRGLANDVEDSVNAGPDLD